MTTPLSLSWLVRVRAHFSWRLVWGQVGQHHPCPAHQCQHVGVGSLLTSHQPEAALHMATWQPSELSVLGSTRDRAPGPRAHLTRPAFSPEMAAFRYCFHAVALSFMSPMKALPSAVLQGGESLGEAPLLGHPGPSLEVRPAQTPRRPCPGGSLQAIPACPPPPAELLRGPVAVRWAAMPQSPVRSLGCQPSLLGPQAGNILSESPATLPDGSPGRTTRLAHPLSAGAGSWPFGQ